MTRILLLLLLGTTSGLHAQSHTTPRPLPATGRLWAAPTPSNATSKALSTGLLGDGSQDHRYSGFWVGAGLGLGLAYLGYEFCQDSDSGCQATTGQIVLRSAFVVGMLGTIGALIGAQIDR